MAGPWDKQMIYPLLSSNMAAENDVLRMLLCNNPMNWQLHIPSGNQRWRKSRTECFLFIGKSPINMVHFPASHV